VVMVGFMQQGAAMSEVWQALKDNHKHAMYSAPPWQCESAYMHTAACIPAGLEHCLTTLLTALLLLWVTATWRTGWDSSNNEQLMGGVEVWLSTRVADLFSQVYKNLFPNTASASVLVVTALRSSLNMYFFCI
jgi:hypothetical protein